MPTLARRRQAMTADTDIGAYALAIFFKIEPLKAALESALFENLNFLLENIIAKQAKRPPKK